MAPLIHYLLVLPFLGGIIGDIGGLLSAPFKGVGALASAVWKAIKKVYSWASAIFNHVGAAWYALHQALNAVIRALEDGYEATYGALKWLSAGLIPKWARKAVSDAIGWVIRNVKTVAVKAVRLAEHALHWAKTAVANVRKWVTTQIRHVVGLANRALNWIHKAGNRVVDIVLHPGKLVSWILPSLVTPLARWILNHLASLSTLVLRWILSNIGRFARDIEQAITKIF